MTFFFTYLGSNKPDIIGVDDRRQFTIAEVKDKRLGLEEIYQVKRYKELWGAQFTFLITPVPIPVSIKRLCDVRPSILRSADDYQAFFVVAQFDPIKLEFIDWYRSNPFDEAGVYFRLGRRQSRSTVGTLRCITTTPTGKRKCPIARTKLCKPKQYR